MKTACTATGAALVNPTAIPTIISSSAVITCGAAPAMATKPVANIANPAAANPTPAPTRAIVPANPNIAGNAGVSNKAAPAITAIVPANANIATPTC